MRLVFIAAPFRGATPWEVAENVRRAERAALEVWRAGAVAVCPQSMSALFDKEGPDERYLDGWLAMLERCDAVLVVGQSPGVRRELERAAQLRLPVFRSAAEVSAYVAAWPEVVA